jgi:hypothetical protein
MNKNEGPGVRVVIYPRILSKLRLVLSTTNVGMDDQAELCPLCEGISSEQDTWHPSCRPIVVSEDDRKLEQWDDTQDLCEDWMAEAKIVAVDSYMMVLEDGPDACDSESSDEYSDRTEELRGMCTPDMLGEDGKPVLDRARMTEDQARRLRERRAGGSGTDQ